MDDIGDHYHIFCKSKLDVQTTLNSNNDLSYRENTDDKIKELNHLLGLQNWLSIYNACNENESYKKCTKIYK